ncbi:redoxin domain-containing protein [Rosistilla oblonga]|uniref:redoxin domain-containing protein n=1 Tax=Rosistilla oblonga TaxID=2527990 RepID=UPI003A96C8E8
MKSLLAIAMVAVAVATVARADDSPTAAADDLVPRYFLAMVHAPEVHAELELSEAQIADLENVFQSVDSTWFQSRLLPADQQNKIIDQTELPVRKWFADNTSAKQQQRLKQLECYSQGVRMLLTDQMTTQLDIDRGQQTKLIALAKTCRDLEQRLQKAVAAKQPTDDLTEKLQKAVAAEREGYKQVLKPQQIQKLGQVLGEPFDTGKLKRTYPMAPEFVAVEHWLNSPPLQIRELKGKVVLVHFYAFQCHNCHANFAHYQRWHRELRDKGVVVVGIQTPETSRERDPKAVRAAAVDRQLEFPILVDLGSQNWRAWGNTMWPTVYVVDKQGYIRHWWQGELNWQGATGDKTIEDLVEQLLQEG